MTDNLSSLVSKGEPTVKQCPYCCVYYEEPVPSVKLLEIRDLALQAEIGRKQASIEITKRMIEEFIKQYNKRKDHTINACTFYQDLMWWLKGLQQEANCENKIT